MVSFLSRLKTFIFCTLLMAVIALIAMFYYSLRYSYTSRLEIKYLGTLNWKFGKGFDESHVASTNSSHGANSSIQVYFLQESSRSNRSNQWIKTKALEMDNKNYRNRTSSNSLTNHSVDGSVAVRDNHKQNSSIADEAKSGVAIDGGNTVQESEESLCPKTPSTLGKSRFIKQHSSLFEISLY